VFFISIIVTSVYFFKGNKKKRKIGNSYLIISKSKLAIKKSLTLRQAHNPLLTKKPIVMSKQKINYQYKDSKIK